MSVTFMKLFEYEAKTILKKNGVPTPNGDLATNPTQAREIAAKISKPVAIKAQVLVAGRGKAGGIQFANSPEEAEEAAQKLLGMNLKGIRVQAVWLEEKISAKKELYFSVAVDRSNRCYVAMASTEGGVDIEEVAAKSPGKIVKMYVDPAYGFRSYHARQIAKELGYSSNQMLDLASILHKHFLMAVEQDAELAEMNPLIEQLDGKFVAADARIIIDDNALYRHPEFKKRPFEEAELTLQEQEAQKSGLAYVKLDGDIGIIGNGAGLVMATLDAIQLHGGRPANFLDVGGGASADMNAIALNIVLSDPNVKVVFINILGGITRCDEVANGILEAKRKLEFTKPMVIRLVGTNEDVGRRLLTDAGIHVLDSMEEAAKKAVELVKTGGR
jgi:succinyl-CoA synthetase beta subunit